MTLYYTNLHFLVLFAVAAVLFAVARRFMGLNTRAIFILCINIFFLSLLTITPKPFAYPLALPVGFGLLATALALACNRLPKPHARKGVVVSVTIIILSVLLLKYPNYFFYIFHVHINQVSITAWIGISYMMFRSIDLVVHAANKSGTLLNVSTALAYLLFFPPFVSGPINRYQQFLNDCAAPGDLTLDSIVNCIARFSLGIIKILLIGEWFHSHSTIAPFFKDNSINFFDLVLAQYAFFLYIYFNFAGYSDCAISFSRLLGFNVPENFSNPFAARNLQDFWNRWHISLSHWFRDFIFFPLFKMFATHLPKMKPTTKSNLSIFITFFLMGIWHGDSYQWILYGVLLGSGTVVSVVYNRKMTSRFPSYSKISASLGYRIFSAFLTNSYIVACLFITIDPAIIRTALG
ncbi:Peptidoglycan O-acetyltransferase [Fundidesulfovibrio magnetotacticus]|uniref:Peptidoglycan O-acetyltransferase n=1 Tax=Fundidesulfovibrio magnetotacticus TaxID=2730080 RepID=A0A6V8LSN0_9BACT|nr:MBOAT family O-acyltransferase [Fundidesulfovibrio magnetotacticus]GFK95482.1 Peptidoglycan O-acetyltransferase [Fundidesulfovibrio magnetotacticus]